MIFLNARHVLSCLSSHYDITMCHDCNECILNEEEKHCNVPLEQMKGDGLIRLQEPRWKTSSTAKSVEIKIRGPEKKKEKKKKINESNMHAEAF